MKTMSVQRAFTGAAGAVTLARVFIAALVCLCMPGAFAQTAPDGNAHPATQNVAAGGAMQANPFGAHNTDTTRIDTASQKSAFAATLNLEPLRSLSVFHNVEQLGERRQRGHHRHLRRRL